jgi:gliding motility-associated-like protein
MSPAIEICPGDSIQISVTAVGGYGDYFYDWSHSDENTSTVWVSPNGTSNYTVTVSDECQTFTVVGSTQVIVIQPTADFTTTSTVFFNDLPITFLNLSQNAVTYEWTFGDGNSSVFTHPSNVYDEPGMYFVTLIATDEKGCTDTITKPMNIEEEWYIYIPNTFTPDGDRHNNDFRISTVGIRSLTLTIFNRWGEVVYTDDGINQIWDGTYLGSYVNDGTYTYQVDFITNSGRDRDLKGHVNVLR